MPSSTKVAVIQAAPVIYDKEATLAKIQNLLQQAAAKGAQLALFPEAFIPAYPRGLGFGTVVGSRSPEGRSTWLQYYENAVDLEDGWQESLGNISREVGMYMGIGVIEKTAQKGTLYCTLLLFDPEGRLVGKHRKLKPTAAERIIWGEGDGSTVKVYDSPLGKIGGLICWENYMPLARVALYEQGVQIYLAPTADQRKGWVATMQHIALEGRCYVLGCNQFITRSMYPKDWQEEIPREMDVLSNGGSLIVSPLGEILAGPLYGEEGILIADCAIEEVIKAKLDFDVCGHYSRKDVFKFEYLRGAD